MADPIVTTNNTLKNSKWIECESKSRPGKKYLFNKATGECKWINPEKPNKTLSTPANDRLKRLRTDLQRSKPANIKSDEKDIENKKKKNPSKIKKIESISTLPCVSPKDRLKILQKKVILDELSHPTPECLEVKSSEQSDQSKIVGIENPTKRSASESIKTREVETVRKKVSLNIKQKDQKPLSKTSSSFTFSKENGNFFRDTNTSTSVIYNIKNNSTHTAKKCLLQQSPSQKPMIPDKAEVVQLKFLSETPKNRLLSIKKTKFSANARLERFRKSLQSQNEKIKKNLNCDNYNSKKLEFEPMDWEPTEEISQNTPGLDSLTYSNNNTLEEPEEMEVDENLMLVAAGETQENKQLEEKWKKNFTYIVLDTNIFIKHLSVIDKLRTKKITDASNIILYIPYTVLQELDKLKVSERIKGPVVCAIRYLNKMFEEKNETIQAQNAMEECQHLIDVESPDDSILNCCLQVQTHIPNVILLTEDVNLRNKAMCNNIVVSTTTELLNKSLSFVISKKVS